MPMHDTMSAHISAVTVTYNSAAVIEQCLDALRAAGVPGIVVDNASTDDSAGIAARNGAHVLRQDANIGFGRGMNVGAAHMQTPYCLLINPDATITAEALGALLAAAETHPNAVIVAPKIIEPDGRVFEHRSVLEKDGKIIVSGACLLVRREWFLDVGGFDPAIFLFYEDDDLCRRAWDGGHEVLYVPEAQVLHLRGKSVAPSFRHTYTIRYHQAWSRRYVCQKYGLPHGRWKPLVISFLKLIFATLTLRKMRMARYLGSLMGNLQS